MFKIFQFEQKQYENKQSKQDKFYSTIFTFLFSKKNKKLSGSYRQHIRFVGLPFFVYLVWLHPAEISQVSGLPYKNDGFSRRTC